MALDRSFRAPRIAIESIHAFALLDSDAGTRKRLVSCTTVSMERILVCLDGSQRAPHVLAAAVDMARATGARLDLFRAVEIPDAPPLDLLGVSTPEVADVLVARARADLDDLASEVPADLIVGRSAQPRLPWDVICRAAHTRAMLTSS